MNVLNIILFIFWITITSFLYIKWYVKNSSEKNAYVYISGFVFKMLMGCLYGYLFQHFYGGDDTWLYHKQSLTETANLLNDPLEFIKSLFLKGRLERYEMNGMWKEVEYTIFVKILSIFNLISGGNYYLNIIIYASITFPASVILINLFSKVNPDRRNLFCIVFFFFVPFVFWTSGIRREGFILLFFALSISAFSQWIDSRKHIYILKTIIALLMLGIFRYSLSFSVTVMLILWQILDWTSQKWKPIYVTIVFSFIAGILFFSTKWTGPVNLPGMIADQQKEFMQLKGGSYLYTEQLNDKPLSFFTQLPQAIDHVFFRPYPNEKGSVLVQISKIETWLVVIIAVFFFISKPTVHQQTITLPLLFFIILNYLILGYTVPFLGAIVRYRVLHEVLLIAWMLSLMNFNRIRQLAKHFDH